jgi:RHS repeat-associated protein
MTLSQKRVQHLCRLAIIVGSMLYAVIAQGQGVPNQLNTGYPENSTFHGSDIEKVQFQNGNLHVSIPIWSAKGRGLNTSFAFVYDNLGYKFQTQCFTSGGGFCRDTVIADPLSQMVLTGMGPADYKFSTPTLSGQNCSGTQVFLLTGFFLREPDGTKHHFAPDPVATNLGICGHPMQSTLYADDGSGWTMQLDLPNSRILSATNKNGTKIADSIVDANGNQLALDLSTGARTDTLGRPILTNGSYYDSSGTLQSPVVTTSGGRPTQITLPNNHGTYSFSYMPTVPTQICTFSNADQCFESSSGGGEIASITLPTGGQITYTWGDWGRGGRKVASRTVSANGVTGTWNYQIADTVAGNTMAIVTDPSHKDMKFTSVFTSPNSTTESLQYFDGVADASPLIKTVQTDYLDNIAVVDTAKIRLAIRETTTWNQQNLVSKVETDWDVKAVSPVNSTFSWKNPVERREYDWGTGVPGGLLRRTHYAYRHLESTGQNYLNANIADLPTLVQTFDGANNLMAQTQNTYDGTALTGTNTGTCQAPSVPGHDYCNYGPSNLVRGNLTQSSRWLNTNGTWVSTNNTYDDLGNMRSTSDPLGHPTTFDYTDSWSGTGCVTAATTYAFPTTVTNAKGQRIKTSYYPCTSLVQSTRDENDIVAGRNGTTTTYDLLNRPLVKQTLDSGGQILARTSLTYNDTVLPLSITKTVTASPSPDNVSTVIMDGVGRTSQTVQNDPEGNVTSEVTYDAFGRQSVVTNPHRSVVAATDGSTQYVYDALGRTTDIIKPDNNAIHTDYAGSAVTVTDETFRQRRSVSDGLGRLIEVDEPGAGAVATSASGWVSISGNDQTGTSNLTITVPNSGFETPVIGAGSFQYGPTGGTWSFVGGGISGNGSGFTSGNPAAPDGVQVAFLQGGATSSISQTLSGFQAGFTYTISFKAAQRGNFNTGGQDFDVYLDSTLLATFFPSGTSYATYSTPVFTTTAGSHALRFVGRNTAGGDNTAFIDAVTVTGSGTVSDTGTVTITVNNAPYTYSYGAGDTSSTVATGLTSAINAGSLVTAVSTTNSNVTVPNSGFETPVIGAGSFQYGPTGGTWSFVGGGISGNGSGFTSGNPAAPEGVQVAFLQGGATSSISQTLSGFQTGVSYTVTFKAAQRGNFSTGGQDFDVYLDSTLLATFFPSGTSYATYSTPVFTTTGGSHALRFVGRDTAGGGNTAFIDTVSVVAGNAITLTAKTPGAAANSYTVTASSTYNHAVVSQPSFTAATSGTLSGGSDVLTSNPMVTLYSYDVFGNLLCVEQHGGVTGTGCASAPSNDPTSAWRVRRFTYDSLSRLLTAKNPEAETTTYQYDNDSNLISKTDARGVIINYSPTASPIDVLHRVTLKTYSDGTPAVTYQYDTGCCGVTPENPAGRMTAAFSGNTELIFSYDPLGRIKTQFDCPPSGIARGFCYVISAAYDATGKITSLTYPDNRVVTSGYNAAGRFLRTDIASFNGTPVNFNYYTVPQGTAASNWGYWPSGAMNRGTYGNGVVETTEYNNRLQISSIADVKNGTTLFSKSYGYADASGRNNGNIMTITDTLSTARNQTFSYDALNRILTGAQADNAFNLTYSYDAWGNMKESGTSNFQPLFAVNNRMTPSGGCSPNLVPYCYDAAGNLLMDNHNHVYAYDGEARIKTVDGTAATYTYNPLGNRVRKDAGATSTEYFFFAGGVIAELNPATGAWTDYIGYGKRVAKDTSNNGTGAQYYHGDHLGSTRIMTDAAGVKISDCTFNPFGEQVICSPDNASNHYRFTGKEHDNESGLDDFGARYFSSSMGRWSTPDWSASPVTVPYATFGDPQSLNLYLYVRNDPISQADMDGHVDNESCLSSLSCYLTYMEHIRDNQPSSWFSVNLSPVADETQKSGTSAAPQQNGNATPHHLGFVFKTSIVTHLNSPGEIYPVCQSCYGAVIQYVYEVFDKNNRPINGPYLVTEHIKVIDTSRPNLKPLVGKDAPSQDRFFVDTIGYAQTTPFKHYHLVTSQQISISFQGKSYLLTTKIRQEIRIDGQNVQIKATIVKP